MTQLSLPQPRTVVAVHYLEIAHIRNLILSMKLPLRAWEGRGGVTPVNYIYGYVPTFKVQYGFLANLVGKEYSKCFFESPS